MSTSSAVLEAPEMLDRDASPHDATQRNTSDPTRFDFPASEQRPHKPAGPRADPMDLARALRLFDRRTQFAIADWLAGRPSSDDIVLPELAYHVIGNIKEDSYLKIADWILTKADPELGPCQSFDDFRDPEVKAACSPSLTIRELDFAPTQQEIAETVQGAEPMADPWENLTKRQRAFLLSFIRHGSILPATNGICHPVSPIVWNRTCPNFAVAFDDVKALRHDALEARAYLAATHGDRLPSFHRGQPVLSEHDKSQIYVTKRDSGILRFLIGRFDRT